MTSIRLMRQADIDSVRQVESIAFAAWWKQLTHAEDPLPPRTHANILVCLEKDPQGCFVAKVGGQLVGFIFSRTWGKVGWFGTFSVLPDFQGCGVGRALINHSLQYLRQDPDRVIGLETMPESPYNLGLYMKMGFQARLPTLSLARSLDESSKPVHLPRWSSAGEGLRRQWLEDLRQAAQQIFPGLDYSKEIVSTQRHGLGETLVLLDGTRAVGMAVLWLKSAREAWGAELAGIQIIILHPAYARAEAFHSILEASEALGREHGKQRLVIPVNARHVWALDQLFARGYRVERSMVRMVLKDAGDGLGIDNYVNCSRWAG